MVIQLKVKISEEKEIFIDLCDTEEQMKKITVLQLKQKIAKTLVITDENLELVHGTKILEDRTTLVTYNIRHMSKIYTIRKLPGGI